MGGSMIIVKPQRFSLLLAILLVVICVSTNTTLSNLNLNPYPSSNKQGAGGLTLKLIHRDLIHPPLKYEYDPPIAHAAVGLGSNLSKAKNINQTSYHVKQQGRLFTKGIIFYVEFYIGTPGVRQIASLDTGSAFLWVQCAGYDSGHQTENNAYNPTASRSYIRSSCQGHAFYQYCQRVPGHRCDDKNRCEYNIGFQDSSHSKGHIGFETISFSATEHTDVTVVNNVLFGCGTDNYNTNRYEDGVFGIGGILQLSIVKQTQRRFSFCIGSISNIHYEHNHLALGNHARLEGVSVPYQLMGEGYGVTFDLIRIGATTIPLPHNFIVDIDSGSTVSHFRRDVYNRIKAQVANIIGTNMQRKNSTVYPDGLCYYPTHIWDRFPSVTLVSHGVRLIVLDIKGMFWITPIDHSFCLAIRPSDDHSNLLGAVAMQYHNVGFDLNSMRVYFKWKSTCNITTWPTTLAN